MYNPVSFTIFNPGDSKWKKKKKGFKIGIYINGRGADPGTVLDFQSIFVPFLASTHKLFHSFYKEIESGPPPVSVKTKNLFLALAETIAQTLMVISYYVCGVTMMGEKWPWKAKESNPQRPFNSSGEFKKTRVRIWHLKASIIGKNCLVLWGPIFNVPVGNLSCLGQKILQRNYSLFWLVGKPKLYRA